MTTKTNCQDLPVTGTLITDRSTFIALADACMAAGDVVYDLAGSVGTGHQQPADKLPARGALLFADATVCLAVALETSTHTRAAGVRLVVHHPQPDSVPQLSENLSQHI